MKSFPSRIVIYTKDVVNITGRKDRTARKILSSIRKKFNKQKGDFVTVEEFCSYTGFKPDYIQCFLI